MLWVVFACVSLATSLTAPAAARTLGVLGLGAVFAALYALNLLALARFHGHSFR